MRKADFIGVIFPHYFALNHLEQIYVMPGESVFYAPAVRTGKCAAKAMLVFLAAPPECFLGGANV